MDSRYKVWKTSNIKLQFAFCFFPQDPRSCKHFQRYYLPLKLPTVSGSSLLAHPLHVCNNKRVPFGVWNWNRFLYVYCAPRIWSFKKNYYYNTWLYLYQPAKWIQIGNRHREAGKSWSPRFYWVQVGIFRHTPLEPENGLSVAEVQRSWPSGQTDSGRWYREQEVRGKWKTEKADSLCISCTRVLQMVFQWHALICIKW